MQDTPGEVEPVRQEFPRYLEQATFVLEAIVWVLIIGYVLGRVFEEDEMRLHLLHWFVRMAQKIAAHVGILALMAEQAYNDTASSMHG